MGIVYIFLKAGDRSLSINEYVFSVNCPDDSTECEDQNHINKFGWMAYAGVMISFILPDILDASFLLSESCAKRKKREVFASIMLLSISAITIIASTLYLYATSISNAVLLKDSVAVLFLNDLDEQVMKILLRICPSYVDEVETDIDLYFKHSKCYNSAGRRNGVVEIASGINLQDVETEYRQEENIGQTSSAQSEVTMLELQDKILHLNRKHEEDREEIRKLRMDNDKNKLKNEEDRKEIRKLRIENDEIKSKNEQLRTDLGILDNKVNMLLTKFPSLE